MKVCIEEHDAPGFGRIPDGSLWADDSPFVQDVDKFETVPETSAEPAKPRTVRKFKGVTDGDSGLD